MAKRSIENFKTALTGGGVRPTMFSVNISLPQGFQDYLRNSSSSNTGFSSTGNFSSNLEMLCKSATIPSSLTTTVTVGLPAGAALKLPGSRIFEPWSISIINNSRMDLRALMETWSEFVIGHPSPLGASELSDFMGTGIVYQLDRQANVIRSYQLEYLYPSNVEAQQLDFSSQDTISEFNCAFNFHYFTVSGE